MATPETISFERLLAPVSDEQPSGIELREESAGTQIYFSVKDAREAARTAERQIAKSLLFDDDDEGPRPVIDSPDWRAVEQLAEKVLAEQSKDLWIAAWFIESLTRRCGFAGLRDGFRLVRELSTRYWDGIHPRPDEDGVVTTVAQLSGLNGEESEGALIGAIAAIPITESGTDLHPVLTGADYADAVGLEQVSDTDRRTERIEQGVVTLDDFDRAARSTSVEFFVNLLEDVDAAMAEFKLMNDVLQEKCGNDSDGFSMAPPSSAIEHALEAARDQVSGIARNVLPSVGDPADDESSEGEAGEGGRSDAGVAGAVNSREDAFRSLLQVADFFRRTEPHSPVSYALEQAVRWGRMSLPELLRELIADESTRTEMARRTGIPLSEADSD